MMAGYLLADTKPPPIERHRKGLVKMRKTYFTELHKTSVIQPVKTLHFEPLEIAYCLTVFIGDF